MKTRATLMVIWVASVLLAVVIVEAYFLRTTREGVPFLLSKDRVSVYKALALVYGANLTVILAASFAKPFPKLRDPRRTTLVDVLALVLTLAYNLILLYLIAAGHFTQFDPIATILGRVKVIAGTLTFLLAPVNAYYFGINTKA
jgi:hypothetical protein